MRSDAATALHLFGSPGGNRIASQLALAKTLYTSAKALRHRGRIVDNFQAMALLDQCIDAVLCVVAHSVPVAGSVPRTEAARREIDWDKVSEAYEATFGRRLPLRRKIEGVRLQYRTALHRGEPPEHAVLDAALRYVRIFFTNVLKDLTGLRFDALNLHVLVSNHQIREMLDRSLGALEHHDYSEAVRSSAVAFTLALEFQRDEWNYWTDEEFPDLSTNIFLSDSPDALGIRLRDYSFIMVAHGMDMNEFNRFQEIIPVVIITQDENQETTVTVGEHIDPKHQDEQDAWFCYEFALNSTISWELGL